MMIKKMMIKKWWLKNDEWKMMIKKWWVKNDEWRMMIKKKWWQKMMSEKYDD